MLLSRKIFFGIQLLKKTTLFYLLFLNFSLLIILFGCKLILTTKERDLKNQGKRGYNFLFLTIDSLRHDSLSSYGNPDLTSPYIDKYFRNGTLFTNMISNSGWTTPSLISMFTSLYPAIHGVDRNGVYLRNKVKTIADLFKQRSYKVPDICYLFVLSKVNYSYLSFDPVEYGLPPHEDFNFSILDWMTKNAKDHFMLWYHYPIVHLPYNPPEPYKSLFDMTTELSSAGSEIMDKILKHSKIKKSELSDDNLTPFDNLPQNSKMKITQKAKALYKGDVRFADNLLGQVFKKLKELGLDDNTIVILTADHGEEIFDHGGLGHASTSLDGSLYDEIINIPLLIYIPGKTQVEITNVLTEGLDILPTLYELNNWKQEPFFLGCSAAKFLYDNQKEHDKYIFSETTPCGYNCDEEGYKIRIRSLRGSKWKLISRFKSDLLLFHQLFDIQSDPLEQKDLSKENPLIVKRLYGKMRNYIWLESSLSDYYNKKSLN